METNEDSRETVGMAPVLAIHDSIHTDPNNRVTNFSQVSILKRYDEAGWQKQYKEASRDPQDEKFIFRSYPDNLFSNLF